MILFSVGALDEWHQSWYEFRSGNDAGDLTADFFGALAGTLVFRKLQPRLFPQPERA
jgi:VanZ family protein